jgi:hypothetical protein
MSKAGGLILILGGLAVAAYVMPSDNDASGPDAARQVDVAKSARVAEVASQDLVVPKPQPAFRPIASATARAAEPIPAFSAPVVVTIAQRASEASSVPSRATAIPRDRDALARELQKELKRVGCYDGELNGAWTPSTRRAMKAFTDRVNATLPVEEPDAVLFVMVQSQQDRVCGKPCPVGQGISEDGRCLPNAILAKATKKGPLPTERPAPAVTGWSTTITAATPASPPVVTAGPAAASPPTAGRMALAGPTTETAPPGAALPYNASPPAAAPNPTLRPPAPPNRVVQRSEASWARTMHARIFDRPN